MSNGSSEKRRRRLKLFIEQNGRCIWCGGKMQISIPADGILPKNACTIDHVFPKTDPRRNDSSYAGQRWVAACYSCNQKRGDMPIELAAKRVLA